MQFTTLNKIINLFLIGTFTIVMIVVESILLKIDIDFSVLKELTNSLGLPAFILLASIFSVPVVIFVGVTVDVATELTVRRGVKELLKRESLIWYFFAKPDLDEKLHFEEEVENLLQKSGKYNSLLKKKEADNSSTGKFGTSFGVAFFFHKANGEVVEWVIQHYSVYLLATSYLFILSLFVLAMILFGVIAIENTSKFWIVIGTYLGLSYLLVCESVRKYLHTWEYTHSHNAVVLCDEAADDEISAK